MNRRAVRGLQAELERVRASCEEANETLDAIRNGQVDALVVRGAHGDQVFTLRGADHTYRILIEAMSEGAITMTEDGMILYCNKRFAEMLKTPLQDVMGLPFERLVSPQETEQFKSLWKNRPSDRSKMGVTLQAKNGTDVPVQLSINPIRTDGWQGLCVVVMDLTQQKASEERLQSLSRRLLEVQELERRHLARELHDEIGQLLTGLKLSLATASYLPRETLQESLLKAQEDVNGLIRRVQDLSLNLRPGMLDDLGLLPTLLWFFERYTRNSKVQVEFDHAGVKDERFPPELETSAYRIIQESLTNVARHAQATKATVRVQADNGTLNLEIADDGIGFDAQAAFRSRSSSGLPGMYERANLLGGKLSIESTPGAGTQLRANLPI